MVTGSHLDFPQILGIRPRFGFGTERLGRHRLRTSWLSIGAPELHAGRPGKQTKLVGFKGGGNEVIRNMAEKHWKNQYFFNKQMTILQLLKSSRDMI